LPQKTIPDGTICIGKDMDGDMDKPPLQKQNAFIPTPMKSMLFKFLKLGFLVINATNLGKK